MKNILTNLSNLKSKIDKLDVDKLVPVPVDLSKQSDVVENLAVKKTEYSVRIKDIEDEIPDITNLATNTTLNAKTNEAKKEIPSINNLPTTVTINAKINEVKNKILNITSLASTTALTTDENKIPNVSNFVEKTHYNAKTREIENKITTDYNHGKYIRI